MITFEHVSKTYANGVKGLDQVDLTIGDGEFVAVIGLSGAGKSTFLRAINRLHDITACICLCNQYTDHVRGNDFPVQVTGVRFKPEGSLLNPGIFP